MEAGIAIAASRMRVERILEKRGAFDKNTAVDPVEAGVNFKNTLSLMEKGGLIGRTREGKIYLTKKKEKTL